MKVRIKGVYFKNKTAASGQVKTYYYDRATGTRLPDDPASSVFVLALERLRTTNTKPVPDDRTFAHLIRECRSSLGYRELKVLTRKEYDRHIKYVEPVLATWPVRQIKRVHVEQIVKKFVDRPTLAVAIKRTLSVLMTYAMERMGWIEHNPCLGMERRRGRKDLGQRPYSEQELAVFRAANPVGSRARLAFEIGLATALRISDIVQVPSAALDAGMIHILTNKTGADVLVGVTVKMREAWEAWAAYCRTQSSSDASFAVCSVDGTRLHKRTLSEDMAAAFTRAGFSEGQRTHALRYTAAVRLLESGFSYDDIAEHTGHRMASMARKYTEKRRSAAVRARVFDKIDAEANSPDQRCEL
jgi:site-specific recombinase XerD